MTEEEIVDYYEDNIDKSCEEFWRACWEKDIFPMKEEKGLIKQVGHPYQ